MLKQYYEAIKTLPKLLVFYFEGRRERKASKIKGIWYLGLFYALELYNYQIPNIILNPTRVNGQADDSSNPTALEGLNITYLDKDILFMCLHSGMFIGMWVFSYWIWRAPKKLSKLISWSIVIHALGALVTAGAIWHLSTHPHQPDSWGIYFVGVGRAIFGIGFAAGLGLAITLVVENFPRSLRTWAATMVGVLGFAGPVMANLLDNFSDEKIILLLIGALGSGIMYFFPPPNVSELRRIDGEKEPGISMREVIVHEEMLKLFGACVFMGVSVQFFSDMVSWLPRVDKFWLHDWDHGLRYSGFLIGTLIAGMLSKFWHSRRRIIIGFILLQLFVVILVALVHSWYKHFATNFSLVGYFTGAIYFLMGLSCGHWIITILQTAEQFSVRERPFMAIVMPNLYRMGTVIIIGLNLYYFNSLPCKESTQGVGWIGQFPGILFAFWIVFVGASLAASILLKDNFEGDAYQAAYLNELRSENKHLANIAGATIRSKLIDEISEDLWTSRDEFPFLKAANKNLHYHFKDTRQLTGCYVLSTIFFAEDERKVLEFAGFGENGEQYDERTVQRYGIGAEAGASYSPVDHHVSVHELIRHKSAASLAGWLSSHMALPGVLIYFGGWREKLDHEHLDGYRTFDLSCIKISSEDSQIFGNILQPKSGINYRERLLDELFDKYGNTFDEAFESLIYTDEETRKDDPATRNWEVGIKKTLLMHRLDAVHYGAGKYYSYYVNPYYGHENHYKIALVLKTVVQLPKEVLGQIRDLLSFIILHRSTKIHKYNSEQFFQDEDHSTRKMLERVKHDLEEFLKWSSRTQDAVERNLPVNWQKLTTLHHSISDSRDSVKRMYALRVMNMALIRYYGGADRKQLKDRGLPDPEPVDLYILLNTIIKQEKKVKITNHVPAQVKVNVIETGLFIILYELIHNAVLNASRENPVINIDWPDEQPSPDHFELHIKNNLHAELSKQDQMALERLVNERVYDTTGRLGIATIHRLLKFKFLSKSEKDWGFRCKASANMVDLYLVIPKEDVEYQPLTPNVSKKSKNTHRR